MARPRLQIGQHGSIATHRRADGRWLARTYIRDLDGVRRRVEATGRTKNAATTRLTRALTKRRPEGAGELTGSSTIADLAEMWLKEMGKSARQHTTKARYERVVRTHVVTGIGEVRLLEARVQLLDRFLQDLYAAHYSDSFAARTCLTQMMALALRYEAIDRNPVPHTSRLQRKGSTPEAYATVELTALRRALRYPPARPGPKPGPRPWVLFDVLLGTGARSGEVRALRLCDLDLDGESPTVTFCGTIVQPDDGTRPYRREGTKAGPGRTVRVPPAVVSALRELIRPGMQPEDMLFATRTGGVYAKSNATRDLRARLAGTEFADLLGGAHKLRRTAGTAVSGQMGTAAAAGVLGNTEGILRKHYVDRAKLAAPDAAAVLGSLLSDDLEEEDEESTAFALEPLENAG